MCGKKNGPWVCLRLTYSSKEVAAQPAWFSQRCSGHSRPNLSMREDVISNPAADMKVFVHFRDVCRNSRAICSRVSISWLGNGFTAGVISLKISNRSFLFSFAFLSKLFSTQASI